MAECTCCSTKTRGEDSALLVLRACKTGCRGCDCLPLLLGDLTDSMAATNFVIRSDSCRLAERCFEGLPVVFERFYQKPVSDLKRRCGFFEPIADRRKRGVGRVSVGELSRGRIHFPPPPRTPYSLQICKDLAQHRSQWRSACKMTRLSRRVDTI